MKIYFILFSNVILKRGGGVENFKHYPFHQNIYSRIASEFHTAWTQSRPDVQLGLIWVKINCKAYQQYQQTTKFAATRLRVKVHAVIAKNVMCLLINI